MYVERLKALSHKLITDFHKTGDTETLEGHKNTLYVPGSRGREQWPHKRLNQTFLCVLVSLWWRCGLRVACCRVAALLTACWHKYFLGRSPLCHYSYHSLASGQTRGREHSSTHQQKTGWKIYWVWPCPPEQDPVFPQPVPPIRKLPRASYPHPSEGRQNESQNHRKITKIITWVPALCNSVRLWATPWRAIQDGRVMVESSDKMWSAGEEDGKPLQHSYLENPTNSMKRQKRYDTKRWTPKLVWSIMLLKSTEIAPEGMKRLSQIRNSAQLWICLVVKGKSDAVKNNIA